MSGYCSDNNFVEACEATYDYVRVRCPITCGVCSNPPPSPPSGPPPCDDASGTFVLNDADGFPVGQGNLCSGHGVGMCVDVDRGADMRNMCPETCGLCTPPPPPPQSLHVCKQTCELACEQDECECPELPCADGYYDGGDDGFDDDCQTSCITYCDEQCDSDTSFVFSSLPGSQPPPPPPPPSFIICGDHCTPHHQCDSDYNCGSGYCNCDACECEN